MNKQNYLCVDLQTHTQDRIRKNHAIFGMMEMTEENEQFEFQETRIPIRPMRPDIRNPKIYDGSWVSLIHKRNDRYQFHVCELDYLPTNKDDIYQLVGHIALDMIQALELNAKLEETR